MDNTGGATALKPIACQQFLSPRCAGLSGVDVRYRELCAFADVLCGKNLRIGGKTALRARRVNIHDDDDDGDDDDENDDDDFDDDDNDDDG